MDPGAQRGAGRAFETPSSGAPGAKQLGGGREHGLACSPVRWAPGDCPPGPSSFLGKGGGRDLTAPFRGGSRSRCPVSMGDRGTQRWGCSDWGVEEQMHVPWSLSSPLDSVDTAPLDLSAQGGAAPPYPTLTPGRTCSVPVCRYCGDHLIPVTPCVAPVLKIFLNSQGSWKYSTNDFPLNHSFT